MRKIIIVALLCWAVVNSQPQPVAQSDPCAKYFRTGNVTLPKGQIAQGDGYCTNYVRERTKAPLPSSGTSGGPLAWWNNPGTLKKGSVPAVGAIVILRPALAPSGHTGVIDSVAADGQTFTMSDTMSEWNYGKMLDSKCEVTDKFHQLTTHTWSVRSTELVGFIYPPGVVPPAPVSPIVVRAALQTETFTDGTIVAKDKPFTKEWTLRNTGSRDWSPGFRLRYLTGTLSLSHANVMLSVPVLPGGTYTFGVTMRAPSAPGTYQEYWRFEGADGNAITVSGSPRIWVRVRVQ
jgi:hypothetical protein